MSPAASTLITTRSLARDPVRILSLVSDRVEANETATTYNTRGISALKDASALLQDEKSEKPSI